MNTSASTSTMETLPAPWSQVRARGNATLSAGIRRLIESGQARPGEPLPSERLLAAQLKLSRNTVRAALANLEDSGLVRADSTRVRRVAGRTHETTALRHTLALIDTRPIDLASVASKSGWPTFVHVAALSQIQQSGYQALSAVVRDGSAPALAHVLEGRPAGVLLPFDCGEDPHSAAVLDAVRAAGIPAVVHCDASVDLPGFDRVCTDHFEGGRLLAEHLIRQGRRRVLRLYRWPDQPNWLRRRDAGFEHAFAAAGLPVPPIVRTEPLPIPADLSEARRFEVITRLLIGYLAPILARDPALDAVLGITDSQALELTAALKLLGRQPHRDIAVLGYDDCWANTWESKHEPTPPAATVNKHYRTLGRAMVDRLLHRLAHPSQPPTTQTVAPTLVQPPSAAG